MTERHSAKGCRPPLAGRPPAARLLERATPERRAVGILKTGQRHGYPGRAWRRSYARRSAAERSNARIKDPATVDIARGWCPMTGLTAMTPFLASALVARNLAVADAFGERQRDAERREAACPPPRTRRRRRTTLAQLAEASSDAAP